MIKIQNIYYMLAYAFHVLNEEGYREVAAEEFKHASDLFAAILAKGMANQIKRGLNKEYQRKTDALHSPVGKINVSASIGQHGLLNKKLVCHYDEYTENSYMNKILKTTAMLLIRCPDVSAPRTQALRKVVLYFHDVDEINPRKIDWSSIQYHRNNQTYKMLLNICYLVIEGMLMTEGDGSLKLARYVDEQRMHRLFEKFVLGYYRKHYPQFNAAPTFIDWNVDEGQTEYLPVMKSDITLQYQGKTLIIDTKFYARTMQTHSLFNRKTFHSNNLYQIFAYVKNMDVSRTGNVRGVLLYAKTDEETVPDHDFIMGGNRISVKTLDLNADFSHIRHQLDTIAEEFLL